jgi:hypothetical protein
MMRGRPSTPEEINDAVEWARWNQEHYTRREAITGADLLNSPDAPEWAEIESEQNYRRGYSHGFTEAANAAGKLFSPGGYNRPREIASMLEDWNLGAVLEWRRKAYLDVVNHVSDQRPPDFSFENWQVVRARILARDKKRCVICGSKKRLRVDHITPVRFNGTATDDNLRTLCGVCDAKKMAGFDLSKEGGS